MAQTERKKAYDRERMRRKRAEQAEMMRRMEDCRFEDIRLAYMRGHQWSLGNPNSLEFLAKAAYDYADKVTSGEGP